MPFTSSGPPAHLEEAAHQALGGVADQDRARRRQRLQARGEVGRVADRRVVHLEVVADRADDDRAGVDADAQLELDAALGERHAALRRGERVADRQRGADRALGRVLVRDRRAEERHHAVAGELVDDALEAVDLAEAELDVLLEQLAVLLGVEPVGDRGRADEVAEQHRDELALAARAVGGRDQAADEALGHVAPELLEPVLARLRARRAHRCGSRRCGGVGGGAGTTAAARRRSTPGRVRPARASAASDAACRSPDRSGTPRRASRRRSGRPRPPARRTRGRTACPESAPSHSLRSAHASFAPAPSGVNSGRRPTACAASDRAAPTRRRTLRKLQRRAASYCSRSFAAITIRPPKSTGVSHGSPRSSR